MRQKILSFLLAAALTAALALPASAANSSFTDVSDPVVGTNADVLRLMGVVSGSGNNQFTPSGVLTRAQFCVMAVGVMGRSGEVPMHTTRTIFNDVTARHWARGYINLASSITVGGAKEEDAGGRLISGIGNGQFQPDNHITYAQAVTILTRILGYTDEQVGAVWPQGYLNMADSLGLTNGLKGLGAGSSINRAQAAQLFVNMLGAENADGVKYCETLGTAKEDVMILAVTKDSIRTSEGTYYPAVDGVVPTALQGRRGILVTNKRGEVVCFVPDGSESVTITLAGDAMANGVKGTNGASYTISSATPAYTSNTTDEDSKYGNIWMDLRSGSQVTLFLDEGKVIAVYYALGGMNSTEAYVVTGPLSSAAFHQITGGATNYTIKKDNEVIRMNDVKLYDVATYDAVSNTVIVSDLRLACVYEKASPNPATPETITVLGHEFPVLETALDSIAQFKLGQNVMLLLTADGKVAGMAEPSYQCRTTATGIAGSGGVKVDLPNGQQIELTGSVPEESQDRVVTVSATSNNRLSVSRISSQSIPGDFNVEAMTLGGYKVAAGVKVYETIGGNSVAPLSLSSLETESISKNQLFAYHLNSSDMVDLIILNAVTGDAYVYGILEKGSVESSLGGLTATNTTVSVSNGSGGLGAVITGASFQNGAFGGAVGGAREIGGTTVAAGVLELTAVSGVKRSDFFQRGAYWYVNAGGTVYQVSSKVEGYIPVTKSWFSQDLATIRAYSNDMTVYVDPVGHKVRIIAVK